MRSRIDGADCAFDKRERLTTEIKQYDIAMLSRRSESELIVVLSHSVTL